MLTPKPFIAWWTIGGSSFVQEDRTIGLGVKEHGWKYFTNYWFEKAARLGYHRHLLHNPGGVTSDEGDMKFDQLVLAEEQGLPWVAKGFVEAFKPYQGPNEVIAYLGTLVGDVNFNIYPADNLDRVKRSVELPLRAGMPIALDAQVLAKDRSFAQSVSQLLKSMGVKIYCEGRPELTKGFWAKEDLIIINSFFLRSDPNRYEDAKRIYCPNSDLTGEVIRLIIPAGRLWPQWRTWLIPEIRSIIADGNNFSFEIQQLLDENVSYADLMSLVHSTSTSNT